MSGDDISKIFLQKEIDYKLLREKLDDPDFKFLDDLDEFKTDPTWKYVKYTYDNIYEKMKNNTENDEKINEFIKKLGEILAEKEGGSKSDVTNFSNNKLEDLIKLSRKNTLKAFRTRKSKSPDFFFPRKKTSKKYKKKRKTLKKKQRKNKRKTRR